MLYHHWTLHLRSALIADITALVSVIYALAFTPADITSMMVAVTALITAIGIAVVNIIAARAVARKVDLATGKIDEVQAQGKVIEGHVNSAAAASAAKIDGLEKEIVILRSMIADKKETAALLAQSQVRKEDETTR